MSQKVENYSKLKVPELKKLLKERGMSMSGTKSELIERLIAKNEELNTETDLTDDLLDDSVVPEEDTENLEDLEEDIDSTLIPEEKDDDHKEVDEKEEDALLKDMKVIDEVDGKTEVEEKVDSTVTNDENANENTLKSSDDGKRRIVKLSSISEKEKLEMRLKKFGIQSDGFKMNLRAARFSSDSATESVTTNVLKSRAERFGITDEKPAKKLITSYESNSSHKLKQRAERFGLSGPIDKKILINASPIEKKRLRAQRFNL